jgi:hypothetical protein
VLEKNKSLSPQFPAETGFIVLFRFVSTELYATDRTAIIPEP